jgi:hypothetical protein
MKDFPLGKLGWVLAFIVVVVAFSRLPRSVIEWTQIGFALALVGWLAVELVRGGVFRPRRVYHVDQLPDDVQRALDEEYDRAWELAETDEAAGEREERRAQAHELDLLRSHLDGCHERVLGSPREAKRYRRELQDAIRLAEELDREMRKTAGEPDPLEAELGAARRALFEGEIAWAGTFLATAAQG